MAIRVELTNSHTLLYPTAVHAFIDDVKVLLSDSSDRTLALINPSMIVRIDFIHEGHEGCGCDKEA